MYVPRVFREDDATVVQELMQERPFATVVVAADDGTVEVAHVPVLFDRGEGTRGTLRFHVARANPVGRLAPSREVTVVFHGPHGYVSPRWYERPGEEVPTWNYAVVHASGRARKMSRDELLVLLDDLAARFDGPGPDAWRTSWLAAGERDAMLAEIVGLSVPVARIEGKAKLSQNRSAADRSRVLEALRRRAAPDDLAMAARMASATSASPPAPG